MSRQKLIALPVFDEYAEVWNDLYVPEDESFVQAVEVLKDVIVGTDEQGDPILGTLYKTYLNNLDDPVLLDADGLRMLDFEPPLIAHEEQADGSES